MPRHRSIALAAVAVSVCAALLPRAGAAQGALSVQGFGYPTGQLSTRAIGTAGALGEFDPSSPINPAQVSYYVRPTIGVQYDPEFRTVDVSGRSEGATVARFPVFAVGLPARRLRIGLSASSFLDRTFSTTFQSTRTFDGVPVGTTEALDVRGAITDVRLAVAGPLGNRVRVGVAGHVFTGENRVLTTRTFDDPTRFAGIEETTAVDFRGSAVSAGVEVTPVRGLSLAGSYRLGQGIDATRRDTTVRSATVPDRYGVAVRLDRVSGASFAASWARTRWSDMASLGGSTLRATDGDELRAGVEAVGPKLGDYPVLLRLGAAQRDLPFGLGERDVRETTYGGGFGVPFSGGRAMIDLGLQRASRSLQGAVSGAADAFTARERAWQLSIGLTLRP